MKKFFKLSVTGFLVFFIYGCSLKTNERVIPKISWDVHKKIVEDINDWHLKGKVAFNDGKNAASANIDWIVKDANYKIRIYGPFGANSVIINKLAFGEYNLTFSDGEKIKTNSVEELMQQRLGWYFPIKDFVFWVRGIPLKNSVHKYRLNNKNKLFLLKQNNWEINYKKYKDIDKIFLPTKFILLNASDNIKIKFFIRKWEIFK